METQVLNSILDVREEAWAKLVPKNFPFWETRFLGAFETSGCLGRRTGWVPQIFVDSTTDPTAAVVGYLKSNSYGEYIFDFAWANAAETLGIEYYPKLVLGVPFTPATGARLLGDADAAFARAIADRAEKSGLSSVHALFIPECEIQAFVEAGYLLRRSYQFHYLRPPQDLQFADYLGRFKSKRRREIRREREEIRAASLKIERLRGSELRDEHAATMSEFYATTVEKRGGFEYLTPEFFHQIFRTMKDEIFLVWARDGAGVPIAGALNFVKGDTLYGRQWGSRREYRSLHFELCYYQGIEFMMEEGLRLFEAGAQGEHKYHRGFLPRPTYSAHAIFDPRLRGPVAQFLAEEGRQVVELIDTATAQSSYREPDELSPQNSGGRVDR